MTITLASTNDVEKTTRTGGENYDNEGKQGIHIRSQSTEEQGWMIGSWDRTDVRAVTAPFFTVNLAMRFLK